MTINYRRDWYNLDNVYYKQDVIDTPRERSPNSAIGAINHFSKPRKLRRYNNTLGYADDGFAKYDYYETLDLWCFIRTVWAGKKEEAYDDYREEGVVTYGMMALYYNPYHINHPKEGIHLHLSNPRNIETMDIAGFADVIEYNGLLWKVTEHNTYDVSYDEGKEYMGKATISRIRENPINKVNYNTNNDNTPVYKIK